MDMCRQLVAREVGEGMSFSAAHKHLMLKRMWLSKMVLLLLRSFSKTAWSICVASGCTESVQVSARFNILSVLAHGSLVHVPQERKLRSSSAHGLHQDLSTEKDARHVLRDGLRWRQRGQPAAAE